MAQTAHARLAGEIHELRDAAKKVTMGAGLGAWGSSARLLSIPLCVCVCFQRRGSARVGADQMPPWPSAPAHRAPLRCTQQATLEAAAAEASAAAALADRANFEGEKRLAVAAAARSAEAAVRGERGRGAARGRAWGAILIVWVGF